jgi:uncharacterized protein (DUF58 family)
VERSQNVFIVLDAGRMMAGRIGKLSKLDYAINAALMLAHVALKSGDRVGLMIVSDDVDAYLPLGKGQEQFNQCVELLYGVEARLCHVDYRSALGMLGIDAVSDQRLVMDFRKKQMTLTKTVRREPDAAAVVVRAKSKYGQLLLVDSEVEGIPLYVIIDTGSEVTVGNDAMRRFLARRRASGVDVVDVAGGTARADLGQLPELHIGKVIVLNEQVAYADLYVFEHLGLHGKPSLLLGMSTLRKCAKVSIDFPAREVSFLLA